MSQLSISGAVSGVDTATIINQLVSVQQNQQKLLTDQQTTQQKAADTYGALMASLGGLSTLAAGVAKTSAWAGATGSSSSPSVTVTATGNTASSLTFDVTSVAAAHAVVSSDSVASLSTQVAAGPLTVTKADGTTSAIAITDGSLSGVVAAINGASAGLSASAVQTSPGQFRLQVSATATGAASTFTLDGLTGFTGMGVLTQGKDATISFGADPATAYQVTSSTNTFAGLAPGLSVTVSKVESGITAATTVDGSAVAGQIQKLVDAANGVLSSIATATAWNPTTKAGGPLLGDSTARSLQQNILNLVSGAGAAGISLTQSGTIAFDATAFGTAFKADPTKVMNSYGASATFTPASGVTGTVAFTSSTSDTRSGSFPVNVSLKAAVETWQLTPAIPGLGGDALTLSRGASSITHTLTGTETISDVVNAINRQAADAGFGVSAAADNAGHIVFSANTPGAAQAFTASFNQVAGTQLTAGTDVQGSIDGQVGSLTGSTLSLPSGTGGAVGLSLDTGRLSDADIAATRGNVGTITYKAGLAQGLVNLVADATSSTTGFLVSAQKGRTDQVKSFQDQIDSWDRRLASYRSTLQTQFTAMETAISALKSSSSFLSGLSTSMLSSGTTTSTG